MWVLGWHVVFFRRHLACFSGRIGIEIRAVALDSVLEATQAHLWPACPRNEQNVLRANISMKNWFVKIMQDIERSSNSGQNFPDIALRDWESRLMVPPDDVEQGPLIATTQG